MSELFKWLSSNPIATTTLVVSFGVLVAAITLTYLIAFFEGREISFWPPKIGGKSINTKQTEKPRRLPSDQSENELRKIFALSGSVVWSRSFETKNDKINIRAPDSRVSASIMALSKKSGDYEDSVNDEDSEAYANFAIERPADHLIATGSPRYNRHADQLQKYFDIPYEYLFASFDRDPGNRTIKIMTEHGDELTSSQDYRGSSIEIGGVDYGILFLGNLSNGKKVFWISGIHGIGTDGAFQYLKENADQIRATLNEKKNTGLSWLLRVQYKNTSDRKKIITDVECLGRPRECYARKETKRPDKMALICDLGNVIMYFDRTRTYRAIAHLLDIPFEEIKRRIESTDLRQRYELGSLTDEEFRTEFSLVIGDRERRLAPNLLDEFWGDIFWLNNEMLETLKCLKQQGVTLILLSNTNHLQFRRVEKDYPDLINLFDEVVLSYKEKKTKPNHDLFLTAIQRVRDHNNETLVEDILYVDDTKEYVSEANELGMKGFVFRSYPHFVFWIRKMGLYIP